MRSFQEDYSFGIKNEDKILPIINGYFKDNIKKSTSTMSKNDYYGDKYIYELKSRTNKYDAYPTTLLGYNKRPDDKKQHFLFSFSDGLYTIEYSQELFSTFETKPFCRNQRSDYNDKPMLYYFIPINKLTKIDT
jgi:hypothetical protein